MWGGVIENDEDEIMKMSFRRSIWAVTVSRIKRTGRLDHRWKRLVGGSSRRTVLRSLHRLVKLSIKPCGLWIGAKHGGLILMKGPAPQSSVEIGLKIKKQTYHDYLKSSVWLR